MKQNHRYLRNNIKIKKRTEMKYAHFLYISFVCAALALVACEKSPGIRISSRNIIIDAFQEEPDVVDISASVEWTVTVIHPDEEWLTVSPKHGKGNATIALEARDNPYFTERTALIAISGNGTKTDTIKVVQLPDVDISEKISDEAFREYCLIEFDNDPKDGKISAKEARSAIIINAGRLQIKSLAGIEYFTRLTRLNCRDNDIESLDLSKNLALRDLNCYNNSIKSLDLSNNIELRYLDCSYNPINHIDVGKLAKLNDLLIHSAELTNIDVSNNTALLWLAVSNNKISNIDVSNNKALQVLECNENGLDNLSVSGNSQLRALFCGNNKLSRLNLDNNSALTHLYCNNNSFDNLILSNNTALQALNCSNNSFSALNLTNCTNLTELYCSGNLFSTLSLNTNTELKQLHCDGNPLTSLNLSYNTKLEGLICTGTNLQNEIDISKNDRLTRIELQNNDFLSKIYVWQGFLKSNPNYKKNETANWYKKDNGGNWVIVP